MVISLAAFAAARCSRPESGWRSTTGPAAATAVRRDFAIATVFSFRSSYPGLSARGGFGRNLSCKDTKKAATNRACPQLPPHAPRLCRKRPVRRRENGPRPAFFKRSSPAEARQNRNFASRPTGNGFVADIIRKHAAPRKQDRTPCPSRIAGNGMPSNRNTSQQPKRPAYADPTPPFQNFSEARSRPANGFRRASRESAECRRNACPGR